MSLSNVMDRVLLSPNDRVWVYQSTRFFTENECLAIHHSAEKFLQSWSSHGRAMTGKVQVLYNLFVVVSVDESAFAASGCSIDKSMQWILGLEKELSVDLLQRTRCAWINNLGEVSHGSMNEFESAAKRGDITAETLVFNNMVTTGSEWNQRWMTEAQNSWQNRFL